MKKQIEDLIIKNNTTEAKKILFEEINKSPNDIKLYLLLGSTYAFESNFELAIQYYNKAFELAPNDYEVVSTICDFLIVNNCKADAKDIMDSFLNRQQSNKTDKSKFSYFDFILGGGDAINYNSNEPINKNKTSDIQKPKSTTKELDFSYEDLIFGDVNQVLQEQKLDTIDTKNKNIGIKNTPSKSIKPKILFVTFGWNETGGGVAIPKSIAIELAKRGYEIYVFFAALEHPINKTQYYLEESEEKNIKLFGLYNRPAPLYDFDNPLREICDDNVVKAFNKVLEKVNPNIVNIHNLHGLTLEIASIVKRKGIVSTFTTHNYHLIDPKAYMYDNNLVVWKNTDFFANSELPTRFSHLREAYKKRVEKCRDLILNDIDYIFAISNRVKEFFIEFSGDKEIAKNKICVINQLLPVVNQLIEEPITKTRTNDGKIRFAFIGDGLPHKGVHIIAQALQFISNKNLTIDVWGRYFDISEYGRAIKQIDKDNIIRIRGEYSSNDLRKIAENTDIMLFSSIWEEAQGLVLAEALAMNIPVIASKIGGIEDTIIDGFNGLTYLAHSPKALASVINMILENQYKIDQLKANAKLPYTFDDYINHLENIMNRLVKGERPNANEFNMLFRDKLMV